jgi:hypothetical protein
MKYRPTKKTVAAAVRIETDLYAHAMQRVYHEDSNFSRYVRGLIRRDLNDGGTALGKFLTPTPAK